MSAAPVARRARVAGGAILGVAGLMLAINAVWIARHWDAMRPVSPGDQAPAFALLRIDPARTSNAEVMELAKLKGDVVLVDFWAEWCRPCRKAMPAIETVYRRYRDKGLRVISVKTDGRNFGDKGQEILNQTSFPIVWDNQQVARRYRVTTIPHLVLIDHTGVVRYVHRSFSSVSGLRDDLSEQIEKLLARRSLR